MQVRPELQGPGPDVAVIQALNQRGGVSNVNVNLSTGRDVYFSQNEGLSIPDVQCRSGVANIDNVCVCPTSLNSSPFVPSTAEYRAAYLDNLFSPIVNVPAPTAAAMTLANRQKQHIRQ